MNMPDIKVDSPEDLAQIRSDLKRKKSLKRFGCCLGVCAISVAVIFLMALSMVYSRVAAHAVAKVNVERLTEEIQANGEPLTIKELNDLYVIPAGETDKTADLVDAFNKLESVPLDGDMNFAFNALLNGKNQIDFDQLQQESQALNAAASFARINQGLILQITNAALLPGKCRFDVDLRQGFATPYPHHRSLGKSATLLQMSALTQVGVYKNDARAKRLILAMFALADALELEPHFNAQLLRMEVALLAIHTTQSLLPYVDWSEEELRELIAACSKTDWRNATYIVAISERVLEAELYDDPADYLPDATARVNAAKLPLPELIASLRTGKLTLNRYAAPSLIPASRKYGGYADDLWPFMHAMAIGETNSNALVAQLAIRQHQRDQVTLPTSLNELVPDYLKSTPIDPFSNQPLKFRADEKEILVYSVATNGKDDQGADENQKDFTIRISRKPSP